MKNKKTFRWISTLLILWIAVTQLISILHPNQANGIPVPVRGTPVRVDTYVNFNNIPISQIVDDGTYLYLLVDSHRGYVQVYDLNGQYQYMLCFGKQAAGGAFSIASKDGYFYVEDNRHNIYEFQLGEFLRFAEDEEASKEFSHISFNEKSNRFRLRFGSVWRTDLSQPICVIKRPFYSFIYQYNLDGIVLILGVILLVITQTVGKKSKTVEEPLGEN